MIKSLLNLDETMSHREGIISGHFRGSGLKSSFYAIGRVLYTFSLESGEDKSHTTSAIRG